MKKIILFTAVATAFSTAISSCKKEPGLPTEADVYAPLVPESKHILKGITLYTDSGIFELGPNFTAPVRGNIRRINLNEPVMGRHLITLYKVSDKSIISTTTLNGNDIQSPRERIDVNIPVETNIEYDLSMKP